MASLVFKPFSLSVNCKWSTKILQNAKKPNLQGWFVMIGIKTNVFICRCS